MRFTKYIVTKFITEHARKVFYSNAVCIVSQQVRELLLYNCRKILFEKILLNLPWLSNLYRVIFIYFVHVCIVRIYLSIVRYSYKNRDYNHFLTVRFHWIVRSTNRRSSQRIYKSFHLGRTLSHAAIIFLTRKWQLN